MSSTLYTLRSRTFQPMVESTIDNQLIEGCPVPMQFFHQPSLRGSSNEPFCYWAEKAVEAARARFPQWQDLAPCFAVADSDLEREGAPVYAARTLRYDPYWVDSRPMPGDAVLIGYLHKEGRRWVIRDHEVNPTVTYTACWLSSLESNPHRVSKPVFDLFRKAAGEEFRRIREARGDSTVGARSKNLYFEWTPERDERGCPIPGTRARVTITYPLDYKQSVEGIMARLNRKENWTAWARASLLESAQQKYDALVHENHEAVREKLAAVQAFREAEEKYWDKEYEISETLARTNDELQRMEEDWEGALKESVRCSEDYTVRVPERVLCRLQAVEEAAEAIEMDAKEFFTGSIYSRDKEQG
jgi:hypothetical protein